MKFESPASNLVRPRIGTAGWAIPQSVSAQFPSTGSGLERYARRFNAVEINTTFYKSHRSATYARWLVSTPPHFQFAVKLPRAITHLARLVDVQDRLAAFCDEVSQLHVRLGPLLVQLPPSLEFTPGPHGAFFAALRAVWLGHVALEPRHASWFSDDTDALLVNYQVSRVAADPGRHPTAFQPGGWQGFAYWRLHGSPRMYSSAYDEGVLSAIAGKLSASADRETWCVFDNTMHGAAAADALRLKAILAAEANPTSR